LGRIANFKDSLVEAILLVKTCLTTFWFWVPVIFAAYMWAQLGIMFYIHPLALVILDDKLGRRIAEMQGFRLTGTAGVLLRAKEKGLIPAVKPAMEKLLSLNFRLKPDLVKAILELAGE